MITFDYKNLIKNQCRVGHSGALCEACDEIGEIYSEAYAQDGNNNCIKCAEIDSIVW